MDRLILAATLALGTSPAFAQSAEWTLPDPGRGVHVRILRDYRLPAGETASQPIIVVGGSASIDGRAEDDVLVIGGTLRVGPQAMIRGDAVTLGGRAIVDPHAEVRGKVDQIAVLGPGAGAVRTRLGDRWWPAAALGATLVRLAIVLMVSMLLTIVSPGWIDGIGERASAAGTSMLLGVTGQLLFVPAGVGLAVALVMSVIGIPLLAGIPLLVAAAAIVWAAGFAAVAVRAGRRLRGRGAADAPVIDLITGFTAISTVTVLAHAIAFGPGWLSPLAFAAGVTGVTIEYLAWTIGLGAAMASVLGGRRGAPHRLPVRAGAVPTHS